MKYELGIIGGGPAGYHAATLMGRQGKSVVLFERENVGGTCLNQGCIPTKTLLYSAKMYHALKESRKYGVLVEGAAFDFPTVQKRKKKVIRKLVAGINGKLRESQVEVIRGTAHVEGKRGDRFLIRAGEEEYLCDKLLIACGSSAIMPPIPGLSSSNVLTATELLDIEELPEHLVIVGGGVIGIEFAWFYAAIGGRVTVVEMLPNILGEADSELVNKLQKSLETMGITFLLNSSVVSVHQNTLNIEQGDKSFALDASHILVSVGRKPNTSNLGLENIGIEEGSNGLPVNEHCRTNVPNVYAAGDVTGFSLLAHTAYREAEVIVHCLLGKEDKMSYQAIPSVIYTNPELASVGMTAEQAQQQGIACQTLSLPMQYAGRFVAENERGEGLCKIVFESATQKIVGAHLLGSPSSEIVFGMAMAIEGGQTIEQMRRVVFPHPTVSEIIKETLFSLTL